jgi:hypothetical protein
MNHRALRRRVAAMIVVLVAISISSCGPDSGPMLYPVKGTAFFNGKPAAGAIVSFHRVGDADKTNLPHAKVQADGTFRITSVSKDDGVPAGKYQVTFVWKRRKPGGNVEDTEWVLPTRYLSGETSGITIEIKNGPTELEPFQLTR